MPDEDLLAFLTIKDILNAWLYVAVGAALIGVKETWELHEAYEWPEWVFFALIVAMVVICVGGDLSSATAPPPPPPGASGGRSLR